MRTTEPGTPLLLLLLLLNDYWHPDEINKETEIAHTNSTIGAIVIKFSSIYHTKSDFNKQTL